MYAPILIAIVENVSKAHGRPRSKAELLITLPEGLRGAPWTAHCVAGRPEKPGLLTLIAAWWIYLQYS